MYMGIARCLPLLLVQINKAHTAYPDNSRRRGPEILNITDRARTFAFGFNEAVVNKVTMANQVAAQSDPPSYILGKDWS